MKEVNEGRRVHITRNMNVRRLRVHRWISGIWFGDDWWGQRSKWSAALRAPWLTWRTWMSGIPEGHRNSVVAITHLMESHVPQSTWMPSSLASLLFQWINSQSFVISFPIPLHSRIENRKNTGRRCWRSEKIKTKVFELI